MIIFKALIGYSPWILMLVLSLIASVCDTKKTKIKSRWSYHFMRMLQMIVARWDLFLMGCWPGLLKVENIDVDYKKYLGPDWKKDSTREPTTIIANHQSFLDIVLSMYMCMPSVIAK